MRKSTEVHQFACCSCRVAFVFRFHSFRFLKQTELTGLRFANSSPVQFSSVQFTYCEPSSVFARCPRSPRVLWRAEVQLSADEGGSIDGSGRCGLVALRGRRRWIAAADCRVPAQCLGGISASPAAAAAAAAISPTTTEPVRRFAYRRRNRTANR